MMKKLRRYLISFWEAKTCLRAESLSCQLLAVQVKARGLTFLPMAKIAKIVAAVRNIEAQGLSGDFIEAGCALGGSGILLASCKSSRRQLCIFDVFGLIPPPTKEDPEDVHQRYKVITSGKARGLAGETYYGYKPDLLNEVKRNFVHHGIDITSGSVSFIPGLVQDTLKVNKPISFAHIDVDWYEPVKVCLERIHPNLVVGGCMVLDDYAEWGGCRKATDEFLNVCGSQYQTDASYGSLALTKIRHA